MLKSVQICKKCTILGNLRTITQEGKKETRQMTPFLFFLSTFWAVCDNHFFVFENCQNSFSWGPPLVHAALQNTWILKLKAVRSEFYSFQFNTHTGFTFSFGIENHICLISWSSSLKFMLRIFVIYIPSFNVLKLF